MIAQHNPHSMRGPRALIRQRGTTLIELLVSVAILIIIGGAGFGLFNSMSTANINLQSQQGLNMALRSASAQLQMDLANAGNGYFQGVNVPSWPVGVTIQNNWVAPGTSCYNNGYTSKCFDQINIITADPLHYPAVNPTDSNGDPLTLIPNLNNSCGSPAAAAGVNPVPGVDMTTVYALPAPSSQAFPMGLTVAQTAAKFSKWDQLLFLHTTSTGTLLTTSTVMNVNINSQGTAVALTVNQTYSDGSNILGNDSLDITACDRSNYSGASPYIPLTPSTNSCPPSVLMPGPPLAYTPTYFGANFCGAQDWIVKLSPISYQVCSGPGSPISPFACDQSSTSPDIADPKLVRTQNNAPSTVMDQIIGFKAGASLWNAVEAGSGFNFPYYNYNSALYQLGGSGTSEPWNFSLVRSVRISMIARSAPSTTTGATPYHNSFDGGPYQVRGTAIIVNPRNLSMSDDQTQALQ